MSQAGVYAENKMVWWYGQEGRLPDAPKQVQLILSDLCNQDCSFCAYRMSGYTSNELFVGESQKAAYGHNNPKRWILTKRALSLLDEMKAAGVLSVQFTGGGEPTVHPDHEEIFDRAINLNLRCALVSNGIKWGQHLIYNILPDFDWVRVSIDAGNANSYSRIRRTPERHWNRVWENVFSLAKAIYESKSKTVLGVGFVVTPDSYPEIHDFTARAKRMGAHNVRFTAMFSPEDERPFVKHYESIQDLLRKARSLYESPDFIIYDNFGSRFEDLNQHEPDYSFCSYQYYTTYIGGDLKAYRCCVTSYSRRGLVNGGDLTTRSFDEFWKSKERKEDMMRFDAMGCDRCQFNFKNRGLLKVMTHNEPSEPMAEPSHKEWP